MSKLREGLTNPKDIERDDRNYNSCETIMTQAELDEELAKARNDVLDKIRAEIENDFQFKQFPRSPWSCGLRRAIEIIDNHRRNADV